MPINQVNQKEEVPRWRRLSEMCIPELKDIQNMSFIVLKNVSALFEDSKNIGVGIPTTITATGSKFLALGTSLGNILLF